MPSCVAAPEQQHAVVAAEAEGVARRDACPALCRRQPLLTGKRGAEFGVHRVGARAAREQAVAQRQRADQCSTMPAAPIVWPVAPLVALACTSAA